MTKSIIYGIIISLLSINCTKYIDEKSTYQSDDDLIFKSIYKKAKETENHFKYDSTYVLYNHYLSIAKSREDSVRIARGYFNLARLDFIHSDYLNSENNAIRSLQFLKGWENEALYELNLNLLGLVLKSTFRFEESINYFDKYKIHYYKKKDTLAYFVSYQNNKGNVYQKKGSFQKSIYFYDNILNTASVKIRYPKRYARALDNKAWSLFNLNKKEKAFSLFKQSLKIRKKENDKQGILMCYLHLSTYNIDKKSFLKAKKNALKALYLSSEINITDNKLNALHLLAKSDSKNALHYFEQYKKLQDSLILRDRRYKDHTARIRYETNEKEKQIKSQQIQLKKKNKSLLLGTVLFVVIGMIATILYIQKRRIRKQKNFIENLQKELHHRTKGNLRHINTFIDVAKEATKEPKLLSKLDELQSRIGSIFEIHQQLYKSKDVTQLNLGKYIAVIGKNTKRMFNKPAIEIIYNIDENLNIVADKSFALGLIINEFLTNSFKYAFVLENKGNISITIQEINQQYHIELVDNGIGLPKDFEIEKTESFGLRIIKLLILQLNGIFALDGTGGVQLNIQIPK